LGLIVLKKGGAVDRVIGKDFALELNFEPDTNIWHASRTNDMYGYYTVANEKEIDISVGGYGLPCSPQVQQAAREEDQRSPPAMNSLPL